MNFPGNNTIEFAIELSDNGYILYYETTFNDTLKRYTRSKVYPENVVGQKDLMTDIIDLMGWFPAKHQDGIQIAVTEHKD